MTPPPPPPEADSPSSAAVVDANNGVFHDTVTKSTTPRLPRWTRHEILVLIQGKRVAESQLRRGRLGSNSVDPKWVSISSYCKRLGVNREPLQCRKRWANLSGDFRKIKDWDSQIKQQRDSFWMMRNDFRRDNKLPGFFDREIYHVLERTAGPAATLTPTPLPMGTQLVAVKVENEADLGASTDEEEEEEEEAAAAVYDHHQYQMVETPISNTTTIPSPMPISGRMNMKEAASNAEKCCPFGEGQKRRRMSSDDGEDTSLQEQLVKILESNNKMVAAQLEAQNVNCDLDRDQRKDQGDSLVAVLNKLVDALGKIADKI